MPQMAGAGGVAEWCGYRKDILDGMPTPQREPLRRMNRAERAALQRIVTSSSERIDQVRRATALLAVARTGVFIQAAREAGLRSGTTVADLVGRFNRHGLAAVRIASGRGRRPTYTPSALASWRLPSDNQIGVPTGRPPGRSAPCNAASAQRTSRRLARAPFDGCCTTPAARTSARARGARPAWRSANARPVSSLSLTRTPK